MCMLRYGKIPSINSQPSILNDHKAIETQIIAAINGQQYDILELILTTHSDDQLQQLKQETKDSLLHLFIFLREPIFIQRLIDIGANIYSKEHGKTALYNAVLGCDEDTILWILKNCHIHINTPPYH